MKKLSVSVKSGVPLLWDVRFVASFVSAALCLLPLEARAGVELLPSGEDSLSAAVGSDVLDADVEPTVEVGVEPAVEAEPVLLASQSEAIASDVIALEGVADDSQLLAAADDSLDGAALSADQLDEPEAVSFPENADIIERAAEAAEALPEPEPTTAQASPGDGEPPLPSDISPDDWAFEAVRALIQRHDCLVGFPDNTFRGDQSLTRFEFAAALHACFSTILESSEELEPVDLLVIERLQEDFATELVALQEAIALLGDRVTDLEANQFSRNFKLNGEIAFLLADAFGGGVDSDSATVFQNRVRLQLSSSIVEEWDDVFIARLTSGDIANGFADELTDTSEGQFVFAGDVENNVTLDRLHYYFSPVENLRVSVLGNFAGHHFYADTLNDGLEVGGGANGAIFQLGERNPIYRLGLSGEGSGLGLSYEFNDSIKLQAGYLAPDARFPDGDGGLFGDRFSALGQLVVNPTDTFKIAFTYLNSFDPGSASGNIDFGATGTPLSALPPDLIGGISDATSNTFGIEAKWDITPGISLRGFGGYSDVNLEDLDGSADIFTFGGIVAFPNLGKEKALGAIIVGAEPFVTDVDTGLESDFSTDVPLQVQALYRYPITDRLFITPGILWLTAPNQDTSNDDAFIGVLRTVFTF